MNLYVTAVKIQYDTAELLRNSHSRTSGRYLRIAHCIVSLYKSVSSSEKTPSGRPSCCARAPAMMARRSMPGVKSKALSGLCNLARNERYTLGREWDCPAGASRLFVGQVLTRRQLSMYAYAKAHAMNYRLMMEEGSTDCGGSSPYRKPS